MCMGVFSVHHVWAWCLQRLEEGIRSLNALSYRVTEGG